ncbi:hypothetical protein [Erwinia sp. HR93]|uniref:hypothetical protein n=1 Tax=Erwinia sp. HR93 TaxID=3094840 RepID=UPI002ADEA9FE|nr:hypothetical protein [Erwinia sp. HR93]MEA1063900.1 hypothetical protein [Erwinia sp. HR93]
MSHLFLESGFGNILAYISGHTNILPTINNATKIEDANGAFSFGVSAAQTGASVWEMIGKELPTS